MFLQDIGKSINSEELMRLQSGQHISSKIVIDANSTYPDTIPKQNSSHIIL